MKEKVLFLLIAGISVLYLQEALSKVNAKKALGKQGYSLYKAAYMGRTGKVKRLIANGVNPNIQSPNSKRTPLHIAAAKGRLEIVRVLIEHGANLEIKNKNDKTPLDFAVEKGRAEIIEFLLKHGAHVTPEIIKKARTEDIKDMLQNSNGDRKVAPNVQS